MRIDQLLQRGEPSFSFEFFPPKTDAGVENLFTTIARLTEAHCSFVSVTYGAGGSTRDRTLDLVTRIRRELDIEPMAHFTCVGADAGGLRETLRSMEDAGVDNVLALRGDPPLGSESFAPVEGGFRYATELIRLIHAEYGFCIGGACYPEGHVETRDIAAEIGHMRTKIEAGASFLITQLFFDNQHYFDFVARARTAGITVPIVPGIMPVTNVDQLEKFTTKIGAHIPPQLHASLVDRRDDAEAVVQLGVAWSTLQCAELLAAGAPGIHFITLNRSSATRAILSALLAARPWTASTRSQRVGDGVGSVN